MAAARDPIAEFGEIFDRARASDVRDATACALATATSDGEPSVRMVLLKSFDERGFVFYTNYGSRKGQELDDNPRAALCCYWDAIGKQVRIEGAVERLAAKESDAYFESRGRQSRIGAWASEQSRPLDSRATLLASVAKLELRYAGRRIPRPEFWGGFRIRADRMEFWSDQRYRLHDRRVYTRDGDAWRMKRLYP